MVEIVVTLTIIGFITALTVSNFREEPASSKLERTAAEFETFCAKVRFQAMEQGADRIIAFDDTGKVFHMVLPEPDPDDTATEQPEIPDLSWKLPEEMELSEDSNIQTERSDGLVEIFRFFPDGGASGIRELAFTTGKYKNAFEISPLTGLLILKQGEDQ